MTVKELKEKLDNALNEAAEVVINTENGELKIVSTIGHYNDCFWIETVGEEE